MEPSCQPFSQLGSSIMKDAHLDSVTHLMGLCVCVHVCEKEKVLYPTLWRVSGMFLHARMCTLAIAYALTKRRLKQS